MSGEHTVVDLFSGAGGFSLGFLVAGYTITKAIDADRDCALTYSENFGPVAEQELVSPKLLEKLRPDVIIGGPPCQPFSLLGKKSDMDSRKGLTRHFMLAVEQLMPKVFVIENVPGYLRSVQATYVNRVSKRLGYKVVASILDAAEHGVAQRRKRAFLIGSRLGWPFFPSPMASAAATVQDAIGDLSDDPDGFNWHTGRHYEPISLKRFRAVPLGGNRFSLPRELQAPCWRKGHRGSVDVFGRLWWERPSVTIRTEFQKPEKGRYIHPEQDRALTPREGARLQSFPDSFTFIGPMTSVVRQIGNAVPPRLAYRIALAVGAHLSGTNSELRRSEKLGVFSRTQDLDVGPPDSRDVRLRAANLRAQ